MTPVLGLMVAQNVAFYVIAATMVLAGLRVVTTHNVVHSALYLVVVLAGAAAQFLILGAEFVGVTQVLVYIGAVIVLFLFGIMLTRAKIGREDVTDHTGAVRGAAAFTALLLAAVTVYSVVEYFEDVELPAETRSTTAEVSDSVFSQYIVAFEATSVLLLAALIGAIVIARKE